MTHLIRSEHGHGRGLRLLAGVAVACLCLGTLPASGKLRIVSWNLESLENGADPNSTREARINSAAFALAKLEPDIVLLQSVPDWKTAAAIASLIDVRLGVRVCSAYKASGSEDRSARQMAVLSHFNSTLSWYENWKGTSGGTDLGYALALLDVNGQRVAAASLILPDADLDGPSADRLLAAGQFFAKLGEIRAWKENAPVAFFFGGTLGGVDELADAVLQRAREEGFTSAFLNLPPESRLTRRGREGRPGATTDYIFAEGGGYIAPVSLSPNVVSDHALLTVDWDPLRTMPVIILTQPAVAGASPAGRAEDAGEPGTGSPVQASIELFGIDLKWWVLAIGGAVLLLLVLMLRRPAPRAFDPGRALSDGVGGKILFLSDNENTEDRRQAPPILTEGERRKLRPHLLRWLKEAFIGTLLRQRHEMIEAQDTATRQADALGRRMEQIQDKLIDRIHKAENRVAELERELSAAKSENRELIQSNLLLAQRELAEARAKVTAQRGQAG